MSDQTATTPSHDEVLASLLAHRTVDIVTTGAKTGQPRTTEIWTTIIGGEAFICGTPNASLPGVERKPRDWLANVIAHHRIILRVKEDVLAELPAEAEPVLDVEERRSILASPACAFYLSQATSFDHAVRDCPMVRLTFVEEAAWLNDRLRKAAADRS